MKDLTKAEEQVMMILWQLDNAYVRDIVEKFSEPKPAYNTVSTIIRILEKKVLSVILLMEIHMNIIRL